MADNLPKVVRWLGFVTSILVLALGITHISNSGANIIWPTQETEYTVTDWRWDMVNAIRWRVALFSLSPMVFVDRWTPTIFGAIGVLLHFREFEMKFISSSMVYYFAFNLVMTLFGVIGYNGGLGIIFSVFGFLTAALALACFIIDDAPASLDFALGRKI